MLIKIINSSCVSSRTTDDSLKKHQLIVKLSSMLFEMSMGLVDVTYHLDESNRVIYNIEAVQFNEEKSEDG